MSTFDPMLAAVMGFAPAVLHYGLMMLVSLTTVGSFQAVGSILVIAFMIGPPVTAYLITDNLKHMLIISGVLGAVSGIVGYQFASMLDVSIAGSMAVTIGIIFLIVFVLEPKRGLIKVITRRRRKKVEFAKAAMLFHLQNHENTETEANEAGIYSIELHFRWKREYTIKIINMLEKSAYVTRNDNLIKLTDKGRKESKRVYQEMFEKR